MAMSTKELLNIIFNLQQEIVDLKKANQKLRDEIRRLKGEKGKPEIKTPIMGDEEKKKKRKTGNWYKTSKKDKIVITRREHIDIDKSLLPKDAEYKGTRSVVIQDIKIETDNVEFEIEKYYSKKQGKTFESELPAEYKEGFFGPGLRHFILTIHYQGRMPQKLMHTILTGMGVIISEGEIAGIISKSSILFEGEQLAACKAGAQKHGYQHIDDTGARLAGNNGATIVTCNESFVSYNTGKSKDRLSALKALCGTNILVYLIDDFTIKYVKEKLPRKTAHKILEPFKNKIIIGEKDFESYFLDNPEIGKRHPYVFRYIKEGAAIAAFRANYYNMPSSIIVCDDAGQFKGLCEHLQLCWVHIARHFKNLDPLVKDFQDILNNFLELFWTYYRKLQAFKISPNGIDKANLIKEFDELFVPNTGYFALNNRIKKVIKKKTELLTVLDYPNTPLHNNPCELDTREKVVQRKIRNCHRSSFGAKASDIFLGLMGTCRKNKISFWRFMKDRIFKLNEIPKLTNLITDSTSYPAPIF